jgi:hypothetical protein
MGVFAESDAATEGTDWAVQQIGQCLKDQYDAVVTPIPSRNAEIG